MELYPLLFFFLIKLFSNSSHTNSTNIGFEQNVMQKNLRLFFKNKRGDKVPLVPTSIVNSTIWLICCIIPYLIQPSLLKLSTFKYKTEQKNRHTILNFQWHLKTKTHFNYYCKTKRSFYMILKDQQQKTTNCLDCRALYYQGNVCSKGCCPFHFCNILDTWACIARCRAGIENNKTRERWRQYMSSQFLVCY